MKFLSIILRAPGGKSGLKDTCLLKQVFIELNVDLRYKFDGKFKSDLR